MHTKNPDEPSSSGFFAKGDGGAGRNRTDDRGFAVLIFRVSKCFYIFPTFVENMPTIPLYVSIKGEPCWNFVISDRFLGTSWNRKKWTQSGHKL